MDAPTLPVLLKRIAPYSKPNHGKAAIQILNSFLPFFVGCVVMYHSLSVSYALTLLLAVPVSGFLLRIFIIQHDCGHGSFLGSRALNNGVGRFCSVFTLTPYAFWQRQHSIHHATSGNLNRRGDGDVPTLTLSEYASSSWSKRFIYRLTRNRVLLPFVWGPGLFLIAHRFPWYIGFRRLDIWRSILLNNVALACVIGLLSAWVGLLTVVQIYLPVVFLAAAFGTWMFHIQHNFQSTYWEWDSEWDYLSSAMKGASYYKLPRVLQWFTGNIGYHHIHHLSSKVPNYELQRAYRENPVFHVRPLSFWAAFREGGLALWDEQGKQLVSFRQARAKQERRLAKPPLFTEQTGF